MCLFSLSSQKRNIAMLFLTFLLLLTNMKAEIVYTNLEPDEELTVPTHSSRNFDIYLNTDMIPDFTFQISNLNENNQGIGISGTYCGNQVMGDGDTTIVGNFYPLALDEGQEIPATGEVLWFNDWDEEWEHSISIPIFGDGLTEPGHWADNPQNKYLGIRFLINDSYHYGWIAIEIPNKTTLIVKGFAYETEANYAIQAGATGGTSVDNSIPGGYGVSLFPNPAIDKITVALPDGFAGKISIINSFGVESITKKIDNPAAESVELITRELPSGIYFVTAVSGNIIFREKLVIAK